MDNESRTEVAETARLTRQVQELVREVEALWAVPFWG